jgi:hypothetical protein
MTLGNQKRFLDLFKDVAGRLTWRPLGFYDKDDLLPFEETQARYSAESWRETSAPVGANHRWHLLRKVEMTPGPT